MQNKMNNRKIPFLIISVVVLVFMIGFVFYAIARMEKYIISTGQENMSAVIEQMEQSYDLRVANIYERLQRIERNLFPVQTRSIVLSEHQDFLNVMADGTSEHILFIKNNGQVMTVDGKESYLDIQSSSLMKLQEKERIAQSVSWNVDSVKENRYLIALPVVPFFVDESEFAAIGFLFERSRIDSLFEVSGYGGQARLFSVDEKGIVTYTNQDSDKYYRNYSLLKHMKQDKFLTEQQYETLNEKLGNYETGVDILGEEQYYIGFCPLQTSNSELVCIVPASVLNNSLLAYQDLAVQMIVVGMVVLGVLCLVLFYTTNKKNQAVQKAKYEEETRKIKEEAMAALEIERDRADYANQAKSQFLSNMSHDLHP